MSVIDPPASPPDAVPTGATTAAGDVLCPMCDYDLRGLVEPRCPECGYSFDWPDLLDPTRRKHKYLFEHHPHRNLWSFARTAIGGLAPWCFWRSLRPEQPSNLRRLVMYWLLTVCPVFIVPAGYIAITAVFLHRNNVLDRAGMAAFAAKPEKVTQITHDFGSVQKYLDHFAPLAPSRAFAAMAWREVRRGEPFALIIAGCACFLVLPWVAALSLMLFQATMRRARVRGAHVLRCCLYSFDGGWWFGLLMAGLLAAVLFDVTQNPNSPRLVMTAPVVVAFAASTIVLLGVVKLLLAYRMYMRFPHALTTVILALIVTALALATIVTNSPGMETPLDALWRLL